MKKLFATVLLLALTFNLSAQVGSGFKGRGDTSTSGTTVQIDSGNINDGTILNADINASANIAGSKLADHGITYAKLDTGATGFVDVRKFGAVGDGVTDDWSAIQAAIDYAYDNDRVKVYIPAGRYISGHTIRLRSGIELCGEGSYDADNATRIYRKADFDSSVIATDYVYTSAGHNFYGLRNLCIRGDKTNQDTEAPLVKFWGVYVGSYIENCYLYDNYGPGLSLEYGFDLYINKLFIAHCSTSTYAFEINRLSVSGAQGLVDIGNLYVETTSDSLGGTPQTVVADRGNAMLARGVYSLSINEFHCESAKSMLVYESTGGLLRVGKTTFSHCGSGDSTGVYLFRSAPLSASIGPIEIYNPVGATFNFIKDVGGYAGIPDVAVGSYTNFGGFNYSYYDAMGARYSPLKAIGNIYLEGNKTSNNILTLINDSDGAAGDSSIIVTPKSWFGIGLTPSERLSVGGYGGSSVESNMALTWNGTTTKAAGNGVGLKIGNNSTSYYCKIATVFELNSPSFLNPGLAFYTMNNSATDATIKMSIKSNGNVGIGTTSPDKLLGLSDGTDEYSISVTSDRLTFWNDAETPLAKVVMDSTGSVGIGTTNPTSKLHVSGGGVKADSFTVGAGGIWQRNWYYSAADSSVAMVFYNSTLARVDTVYMKQKKQY